MEVDLIYVPGCPNVEMARAALRAALPDGGWREWNLASEATPERFRRFGSPTVLVDGRDVTGQEGGAAGMACRADGAPPAHLIRDALAAGE
ncbi:MAG: alkylmercury lyase [Gemmatimonadota bacterium]|jgi:hypothetical protein